MAIAYAVPGWMNYRVRLSDGAVHRVYWRNRNRPYIKLSEQWVAVWIDPFAVDEGEVEVQGGFGAGVVLPTLYRQLCGNLLNLRQLSYDDINYNGS